MPNTCVVPGCKGNYTSKHKIPTYKFPKEEDRRALWIRKIQRKNFTPSEHSRVCIAHFSQEHIEYDNGCKRDDGSWLVGKKRIPILTADAFPSINCPTDLTDGDVLRTPPPARISAEQESRDENEFAFQVIFFLELKVHWNLSA